MQRNRHILQNIQAGDFLILIDKTKHKTLGEPIQIQKIEQLEHAQQIHYVGLYQMRTVEFCSHIDLLPFASTASDLKTFYDDYRQYVRSLADANDVSAMLHFAELSYTWAFHGIGKTDTAMGEAKQYYELASEQGHTAEHAQASYALAQMYLRILNPDYDAYFKLNREGNFQYYLLRSAEQGHCIGQYQLAYYIEYGEKGFQQDDEKAVYWYQQAANQDYPQALNNLGDKYERGKGVKRDYAQAVAYYQRSAAYDIVEAIYNLGRLYLRGLGVEKDEAKGRSLIMQAASRYYKPAQRKLAKLIEQNE